MAWKDTKLYSVLNFKCPYCHEGKFFVSHPYDLKHVGDLLPECPCCHRRYSIEPGFYYGAMYVSYALGVAASVTTWVACLVLAPDMSILAEVLLVAATMVFGGPLFYALSKIIWANLFFPYHGPPQEPSAEDRTPR
ncbi:MAG: DUF983 domain-containing protein [Flavobacteriales bacterium]